MPWPSRLLDDQGKPDYNNVAVCTPVPIPLGMKVKGFETAGTAFVGGLSEEYQEARIS